MSYCMKCLKEIKDTDLKCPQCGAETFYSIKIKSQDQSKCGTKESIYKERSIMPIIGFILGLISLIISFIPIIGLFSFVTAPPGIVVSAIANARFKFELRAKRGLLFSILSLILSTILYISAMMVIRFMVGQ